MQHEKITLNHPLFDGSKIIENASVTIENGVITTITESKCTDTDYFLMPGLIDAHTHINTLAQTKTMLENGVTAACDVAASPSLIETSAPFTIISSAGMTMGTLNGKSYVKKAIQSGAAYIKVLLMEPNLMPKNILKSICQTAHENGLKVAVHATTVKSAQMAVDCLADILIHIPMKESFPDELAKTIAQKKIVVAPTLVMMETFAYSNRNGYKPEHFENAKKAVSLLHNYNVQILAATDANDGSFAPAVSYGSSMHREMELLTQCGMSPLEVLASATGNIAETFNLEHLGKIAPGKKTPLLLIQGRPDKNIADIRKIQKRINAC